jgi:steroid delta-isomerase-like uncharacterized protein
MAKRKASSGKKKARKAATAPSEASAHKRLARRWFDHVWNKRRAEAIAEMMSPKCIGHGKAADGGDSIGSDGFRSFQEAYLGAFPDLKVVVDDVIVEGRKMAVRWVATGTHQGDTLGFPATGREMRITGISIVYVKGGKIVEGWDSYDQHGMLQQLGLSSPPVGSRAL